MKLKSIKGFLPEERENEPHQGLGRPDGWNNFRREGFNEAINQIGEKDLPKMDSVTKGWVRI